MSFTSFSNFALPAEELLLTCIPNEISKCVEGVMRGIGARSFKGEEISREAQSKTFVAKLSWSPSGVVFSDFSLIRSPDNSNKSCEDRLRISEDLLLLSLGNRGCCS